MKEEALLVGYVILAIITIFSFITLVYKITDRFSKPIAQLEKGFTESINELKIVIQELKDCIKEITKDNAIQNKTLEKHEERIETIERDVNELKIKMKMYHQG